MRILTNNNQLVNYLIENGVLANPNIIKAFREIDRKDFVPNQFKSEAYKDTALPIYFGQTISQPSVVAFMLELLDPKRDSKILDIGSGSGYTTALLAKIADKGKVIGLEIIPELAEFGQQNLQKYNLKNAEIKVAKPNTLGIPGEKFDRILISASAEEFPEEILNQLKNNSILVMPVKDSILRVYKTKEKIFKEEFPGFVFVPLV